MRNGRWTARGGIERILSSNLGIYFDLSLEKASFDLLQIALREVFEGFFPELQLRNLHFDSFCADAFLTGFGNLT